MTTLSDTVRMSHTGDPHTSKEAASRASRGTKKALLHDSIANILAAEGPLTPKEIHAVYIEMRGEIVSLPVADLQDIRRRMTELEHDFDRIEPVGRRNGERVMRLVEETNR